MKLHSPFKNSESFLNNSYVEKSQLRSKDNEGKSRFTSKSVTKQYFSFIGRTLAEENLHGFSFKKGNKTNTAMDPYIPQRIELPLYFNTPKRREGYLDSRKYRVKKEANDSYIDNPSALNMSYTDSTDRILIKKRLKDYGLLAFACKRANKLRDEGRAYYSKGVLFDNLGNYMQAIESYQLFLTVCKKIGDHHGEALAYNCIGVAYQKLGEKDSKYYRDSLEYHTKHNEIADSAGKFISFINMGMICNLLGEKEKAAVYHQNALRHAIQMSSVVGQTIAIGNLGRVGSEGTVINDRKKLMMFVERYLELSNELAHTKGESGAHMQLGKLTKDEGDYATSVQHFDRARSLAKESHDSETVQEASVNYGIAQAEMKWDQEMENILGRISAGGHYGS